ncbi:MAG: hypothetical protein H7329_03245 [Opitutaceae bacterium]|nr:hypothetical protein [Cytophagales bacterium]
MTYDQISHIHLSISKRLEGTPFISFIAPKKEPDYKAFMQKAESVSDISNLSLNEILDNPETVRNILDQVPDAELEIYVKSIQENDDFIGTLDQYRQKYAIGYLHDME